MPDAIFYLRKFSGRPAKELKEILKMGDATPLSSGGGRTPTNRAYDWYFQISGSKAVIN